MLCVSLSMLKLHRNTVAVNADVMVTILVLNLIKRHTHTFIELECQKIFIFIISCTQFDSISYLETS